jgi:hypothetical protein
MQEGAEVKVEQESVDDVPAGYAISHDGPIAFFRRQPEVAVSRKLARPSGCTAKEVGCGDCGEEGEG